jgi:hypothetical protein
MRIKKIARRNRVIACLPRSEAEALLDSNRAPWHMTRTDLNRALVAEWNQDIEDAVERYFRSAFADADEGAAA